MLILTATRTRQIPISKYPRDLCNCFTYSDLPRLSRDKSILCETNVPFRVYFETGEFRKFNQGTRDICCTDLKGQFVLPGVGQIDRLDLLIPVARPEIRLERG